MLDLVQVYNTAMAHRGLLDPVIEAYKRDVDRTLIRENLKKTHEERLLALIELQRFAAELRAWRYNEVRNVEMRKERRPEHHEEGSRVRDIDRSAIRRLLRLEPGERIRIAVEEARHLEDFDKRIGR